MIEDLCDQMALWDLGEGAGFVDFWRGKLLGRGNIRTRATGRSHLGVDEQEGLCDQSKVIWRDKVGNRCKRYPGVRLCGVSVWILF